MHMLMIGLLAFALGTSAAVQSDEAKRVENAALVQTEILNIPANRKH